MLLENGTYKALVLDSSVCLRGENERLTLALQLEIEGKKIVHKAYIELNDGTISDRTIKNLRACFPAWDGAIETMENGQCFNGVQVEAVVENEQDQKDPEKWWTKVQFINPPGGRGAGATMPEKANRATLVSKYGSRLRALVGGTAPAPVRAGPPANPPPVKKTPPPVQNAPVSTMEECWEALNKKHGDELPDEVQDRWFKMIEKIGAGKDQAEFTPADWGKVMAETVQPF